MYKTLDELRENNLRQLGKKKNATHKRVDLHRVSNRIPTMPPYPFMVDEAWKKEFGDKADTNEPFTVNREDPPGFGSRRIHLSDDEL